MQRTFAKHRSITQPPPPPLVRLLLRHHNNAPTKTLNLQTMEVEVKLRLPDATSHQKLSHLLSPFLTQTLLQQNIFFDTATNQLSSSLAALRLRFYGGAVDSRYIISLKSKPQIAAGISRVEEEEEPIDASFARACVAEPWRLLSIHDSSRILKKVKEEFGVGDKELVCLGGFRNVRAVYDWKGLKLEVDETHYNFGTSYEIECESADPDLAKKLIEEFLVANGISYSYSEVSNLRFFDLGSCFSDSECSIASLV